MAAQYSGAFHGHKQPGAKDIFMIRAFSKAIGQLSDPRIRSVIGKSVLSAALIFALLFIGIGWTIANTAFFEIGWVETTVDVLGGLATFVLALILFPGIVSALISVLLEDVADAVEQRHYPSIGPPISLSWGQIATTSLRLILLTVALNLLALPFYLIPGVNLVAYYTVNGYLLGREFFEIVALRRLDQDSATALYKKHKTVIWLTGATTAFLFTIPVVNIIAPVIGAAAMVHIFHKFRVP